MRVAARDLEKIDKKFSFCYSTKDSR